MKKNLCYILLIFSCIKGYGISPAGLQSSAPNSKTGFLANHPFNNAKWASTCFAHNISGWDNFVSGVADNVVSSHASFDRGKIPENYDLMHQNQGNDELANAHYEGSGSTTSSGFATLGAAQVTLDVTGVNKVLVVASFSSYTTPFGTSGLATFRTADASDPNNINSGEIEHTVSGRDLIGSIVYIFDVSQYSGNRSFVFQQKINNSLELFTTVTLSAIALYDGANQLNSDVKQFTGPLVLNADWETVVSSNNIQLPSNPYNKGGFYIAASGYNQKTDGGTEELAAGQWVLQYKRTGQSEWKNISYPIMRAPPGQQKGTISLVGVLPENVGAGNYDFRVAHRKIEGTATFVTHKMNLVVVALATADGYFPEFISSTPSVVTALNSFTPVINNYLKPGAATDVFVQSQFLVTTNAEILSPAFKISALKGASTVYEGIELKKYLMNPLHRCSGSHSALINNLEKDEQYQIRLSHAAASGATLTTTNAYFVGFGLKRSSIPFTMPVTVNSTEGIVSSSYASLNEAFNAINTGIFKGNIVVMVNQNLNETSSCSLVAPGTGEASYNSIVIYPTTSNIEITGNISGPLIDLSGARNVTIDGRANLFGDATLKLSNTNVNGQVLRFMNDAVGNTVRYCNIEGVTSSATSGVVHFGTCLLTGNDNNTIEFCDIHAGITTPTNAVYSAGSSVVADNSNITIANCNIYDFFNPAVNSAGIYIASNSSAWTINGNRFFQSATRISTVTATHWGIRIVTASGGDYIVSNNIIGFANAGGSGRTIYQGNVAVQFYGIELTTAVSTNSNVQGNRISGITLNTASGSTTRPGIFSGISVLGGNVNIGNESGNVIGSFSETGSIEITSTVSLGMITGIHYSTTGNGIIRNNKIGSFITGGDASIGYTFNGIHIGGVGGNFDITSNLIGSAGVLNSIAIGKEGITTAVCTFRGIFNPTSGTNGGATGDININNNTIQNCAVFGTGASVYNGILNQAGTVFCGIEQNQIITNSNSGTGATVGISNTNAISNLRINNNIIRDFYKTSTGGTFTAITNSGAVLSSIQINNNQLGNADGGLITYSTTNSASLIGISNSAGAASCELFIQYNDFRGINYADAAGTNAHTYIINSGATLRQEINYNTFTTLDVKTTGAIIFISNSVAMPANGIQNVNNNSIAGSFTRSAVSGAITLFTSTATTGNTNVTVNNNNNNFSNITISGSATISGWVNTDAGTVAVNKTISGNLFENWTGGSGSITAVNVNITSENNRTRNNIIRGIQSSGTIQGIITAAGNDSIYNNTIQNFNSTGGATATIVSGINVSAGTNKYIANNTISDLTGNSLTTGSVRGIQVSAGTEVTITKNTIQGLTANANTTGTISGIWVSGGGTLHISRNKVYNISSTSAVMSSTGAVYGIQVSGTTSNLLANISNNLIADLRTPVANSSTTLRGIGVINTGTNSTVNIFYNSIYLNAESTGANFGTSGIFHTASTTATTARLDMRNNIIVNLSTPKGTGLTVAYRRSSGSANTLNNYAPASNNNLFYSGTPGPTRLIYHDGTSGAQTIAAYKTGVFTAGTVAPRDQASVSENPPFLGINPGQENFLKINPAITTQIESGAANISGYTVDFAGTIRQGNPGYSGNSTSAPDIGAYEGDYIPIDMVPPAISYTPLNNNSCISNKTFSAVITDGTGVATEPGKRPRVYFKKTTNNNVLPATNDNSTNGWKYTETTSTASPFNFTLNFSLIFGGVNTGDVIQYFVVAQDILETPYVGINAGTFAAMPASVALTSSAFPIGGTINSFSILAGLSNEVTIGATGNFASLTGTGGLFSEINAKGLAGNLVARIIDPLITETGTVSLNQIVYGCEENYTLTIRPADGVNATLTGTVDGALIHLSGADYVVFDGINTGGSSLTVRNTSTNASASTIRFSNDAINNTITRCIIEGSPSGVASGIVFFSGGISTGNDNNTVSNNIIRPAGGNLPVNAVYSAGSSVSVDNSGNNVTGNNIQDYFSPSLASNGILLASNSSAWAITGNRLYQSSLRTGTAAVVHRAINIITASGSGYNISNNIIGFANVSGTGITTYDASVAITFRAIELTVATTSSSFIDGNIIAGISFSTSSGSTTLPGIFSGISVLAGDVSIGKNQGNTVGSVAGNGSITISSTTNAGIITGIYATTSNNISIENNLIGGINTVGAAAIGYYFRGIHTAGGGQFNVSNNTIGSTTMAHSIAIGTAGVTTSTVCTFVGISNASTGSVTITGNTIANATAYGTGASVINAIQNTGVSNMVTVHDNRIIGITNTGTGAHTAIINSAAISSLNITQNEIRGMVKTATSGLITVISNTGAVLTSVNINNNKLGSTSGGLLTCTSAIPSSTSNNLVVISNTAGAISCEVNILNNDIRGINYVASSANTNTFILNSAATIKQNINNNTFTNLSLNLTGTIVFISNNVVMPAEGVQNVNGNSIAGSFIKMPSGGSITLFTSTAATNNSGVVVNNNNNNFSNITVSGDATILGWINTDAGTGGVSKTIEGNTFSNWTGGTGLIRAINVNITSPNNAVRNNIINNISSAGSIAAITTAAGSDNITLNTIHTLISSGAAVVVNGIEITTTGNTKQISGNTIFNLQANNLNTGTVNGISVTGGTSNFIFNNRIFNISSSSNAISTGSLNGIIISGSVADLTNTIYNNRIADLKATAANTDNVVRGIAVVNTGLRSSANVYFNSVFLNTSASSGDNSGSSGIFHTASVNATTGRLDLRNNVIVNTSEPKGLGLTVAFRRSTGTANMLSNYALVSNNNLFYAGIPSASNLLYADGISSADNLIAYQKGDFIAGKIAPRDQATVSEMPVFKSTDGADPDFLKISTQHVTFIESGGVNLAGITTDFEGNIRAGNPGYPNQQNGFGTAPDIGADEFDGFRPRVQVSGAHAGSNGIFNDLQGAFAAINAFNQSGFDIQVTILETTNEPGTAVLNSGLWNSLKVFPVATGKNIAGNVPGAPLVLLNGADNVVFDGRVNQTGSTKSMVIVNRSSSGTGTATVRLVNSAENNIFRYCIIAGSSISQDDGVITFSGSDAGNGNSNNIIEYSDITSEQGNRPIHAIYSSGNTGYVNKNNIIRNCNIFDFLNPSISSVAIHLKAFSSEWAITANNFYETTALSPSAASLVYGVIRIDNENGNNFSITGNYFGGSTTGSGGTPFTVASGQNHSLKVIYLNVGTETPSLLQNNNIRNWNYSAASATPWTGIEVAAGNVNIGSTTGNNIGAATGNNSIQIASSVNAHSFGIYVGSPGTVNVLRNNIGSVNITGNETNISHSFTSIYKSNTTGSINISNNNIGSSLTTNSIYVSSSASSSNTGQHLYGIYLESNGTANINQNIISNLTNAYAGTNESHTSAIVSTAGNANITRNTIRYLESASQGSGSSGIIAIDLTGTDGTNTLADNNISNITSTGSGFSGFIAGIRFSGDTGSNVVTRSFVRNLFVNSASAGAQVCGIRMAAAFVTCSNNIISLAGNTATTIYGIYEDGPVSGNSNIWFNSVYIAGTLSSVTTNKSYAFYSFSGDNAQNVRNNIFANFRSTTGGTSLHYAAYFNYGSSANLTLDYNSYFAPGTGGVAGFFNGSDKIALPLVSGNDENSYLSDPGFVNAGGNNADDYKLTAGINGIGGTGIVLDYGQTARGTPPNVGAWEFNTNRWMGTVSTDFNDPVNWSSGAVPIEGVPIVFAIEPVRDCYLQQNWTVSNIVNNQADKKLVINGHELTITGELLFTGGAKIDATASQSTLVFAGNDEAQVIPEGAFLNNYLPNLIISNEFGVVTESDLTIGNNLDLAIPNPSSTMGSLHTGTKVITFEGGATLTGDGDITGIVRRTDFEYGITYAFVNRKATIFFENTGTLPDEISVKLRIGTAPTWKPGAVQRVYDIIQSGANPFNPTSATIYTTYLDSELNGNDKDLLVNWSYRYINSQLFEHGRASHNPNENWIKLTNINMAFFPSTFGQLEIGLSPGEIDTLWWNGSVSSSWTTVNNWTPMGAPSDYVHIIIPDAANTTYDPILPPETTINTLKLEPGAILNSVSGAKATVTGGDGAWDNKGGTFNPGTSTVKFTNQQANISGITDFYNVNIAPGAVLSMNSGATMRISGEVKNDGTWRTVYLGPTTVEYNGGNQTVVVPNTASNRYSTLVLSGSGTKTMPVTNLSVNGDLVLNGTVNVTAMSNLDIRGNFFIGEQATFIAGNRSIGLGGNFTHNGSFNATGSTITFNGTTAQSIDGTGPATVFNNLAVTNEYGVTSASDLEVTGYLDLQAGNPDDFKGSLHMGAKTLLLGANTVTSGTGDVTGTVKRSHTFEANRPYTFGNRFTTITFCASGTKPSEVSIKTMIGNPPGWKPSAIKRIYEFVQTGGSNCMVNVSVNFLESELNGNAAEQLVFWGAFGFPTPQTIEWGRSDVNTLENWLTLNDVHIDLWPTSEGQMEISLAETEHPVLTWNGSQNTSWNNPFNWTPNSFPNRFSKIIVPDAAVTPNDPLLPDEAEIQNITLENGSILNAGANTELTIFNHHGEISWDNRGGVFNHANSTVIFIPGNDMLKGTTNFYNIVVKEDARLTLLEGSVTGIAGSLVNDGVFDATLYPNTVEYNGSTQLVVMPNGALPGYHNLSISGNSFKTLPDEVFNIYGNFSVTGFTSVTANNDLNIEGSLTVGNNANFNTGGYYLKIGGNIIHDGEFNASLSTVELVGNKVQTISGSAPSTVFKDFLVHQNYGAISYKDITINHELCLHNNNPGPTTPVLNMTTAILDLGPEAYVIGLGDATGTVRRKTIERNITYAFGNKNANITFNDAGTLPTEISVRIHIGTAPAWRPGAIKRYYEIIQTGANPLNPTQAAIHSTYLDSELNGNDENRLVNWSYRNPPDVQMEHGRSANNTSENWIELTNINMAFFPSSFGALYITIDESEIETITWNGSVSNSWTTVENWTPNGAPSSFVNVIIPDASTTPYDPYLNFVSEVKTLTIEENGILNSTNGSVFNVYGNENAWRNFGTFNPGNTNVKFNGSAATIAGETNFRTLTIAEGATLTPQSGNIMRIGVAINNQGTLDATSHSNTIEYNGANQTVISPNGSVSGYYHMVLSGSGIKTLPASNLNIRGNLTINAEVSATGNTIIMNGSGNQNIGGTSNTIFNNLTISNAAGVTLDNSQTVSGTLNMANGLLTTGAHVITVTCEGNITNAGVSGYINGKLARNFCGTGPKVFPIGKGGNFRSLTLNCTEFSGNSTVVAEQMEGEIPGTIPENVYYLTNRYWQIAETAGNNTYTLTLDGTPFTPGSGTALMLKGNGSENTSIAATFSSPYFIATGLTDFGNFTPATHCPPPVITVQPDNQVVCDGNGTAVFSVTITGTVSFQWEESTTGTGGTFLPISNGGAYSGANTAQLNIEDPPLGMDGYAYRVVISRDCGSSTVSLPAVLTVKPVPQGSLTGSTVCYGETGWLTWTATSGTGPYTVTYKDENELEYIATPINSAQPFEVVPKPASTKTFTLVSVTDINCTRTSGFTSGIAVVTINNQLQAGQASSDQAVCYGTIPEQLSANAPSGGSGSANFEYQWQVYNGTIWVDITNATSLAYQPGSLTTTTKYRLKQTDKYCDPDQTVFTSEIIITVDEQPDANAGPDRNILYELGAALAAVPSLGTGTWSLKSGPDDAEVIFNGENDPDATVSVSKYGNYTFTWTEVNGTCSDEDDVNLYFYGTATWNGSVSTDWFTAGNWTPAILPDGTGAVEIPSGLSVYPKISGNSPERDVIISGTAVLDIKNGATLTLAGGPLLKLEAGSEITTYGNSKIILEPNARYLNLGASEPVLEVRQEFTGSKGWRMVSSPVAATYADMFSAPLVTQGFEGSGFPTLQANLLWWDETDGGTTLQGWRKPANMNNDITAGKGHFFYIFNGAGRLNQDGTPSGSNYPDLLPQTFSVTGAEPSFYNSSFTFTPLTFTPRSMGNQQPGAPYNENNLLDEGWNLVGNPTASTLNWDAAGAWTKTRVDNVIYIWDPSANNNNGSYLVWNGEVGHPQLANGLIPPFQAFWVHANNANPVLNFTNNAKSETAGSFLKKASKNQNVNLRLKLSGLGLETSAFITLSQDGVTGADSRDAYRLEPMNNTWLALYSGSSLNHNAPLVINNLPSNITYAYIPLYVDAKIEGAKKGGQFTLEWEIPENWPDNLTLTLMDHRLNKAIPMLRQSSYKFEQAVLKTAQAVAINPLDPPLELVKPIGNENELKKAGLHPFAIVIGSSGGLDNPIYQDSTAMELTGYPNPFSNDITLQFVIPGDAPVRLDVFDVQGRLIDTPVNTKMKAGVYEIRWAPLKSSGGVYIFRMVSGNTVLTFKGIRR